MHDFIALEIIDGQLQFSFSLGANISKVSPYIENGVNDGNWHHVTVDYLNLVCFFFLVNCTEFLMRGKPPQWWSGRGSASCAGGRGFDPKLGHTKDLKNLSNGCPPWSSGFRGLALRLTDWCEDKWTSSTGNLPQEMLWYNFKNLKAS